MMPNRNSNMMMKPLTDLMYDLPAPSNLSYMWNFGSLMGLAMTMQIITGLILSMHYSPSIETAFSSVSHLTRNVNIGWVLKYMHMNGASMMFFLMYMHMGRNMYYKSYKRNESWNLGVIIYLMTMATAFMGYLLPWGQMSFWGATVITNMFSAIPYVGQIIVMWLWGGYAVSNPTLTRFFALHYLLPFMMTVVVMLHLLFLHNKGSNNPLSMTANYNKVYFAPYYTWKDVLGIFIMLSVLILLAFYSPNLLNDPENFIPANPLMTPTHIKPEWYFLWAYAILRSVPSKLGGVVMMFLAIVILLLMPLMTNTNLTNMYKLYSWLFLSNFLMLTWIGGSPVEYPYNILGMMFSFMHFALILSMMMDNNKYFMNK